MNKIGMNEQQKTTSYYSRLYLLVFVFGFLLVFFLVWALGYDYLCRLILVGNYKNRKACLIRF